MRAANISTWAFGIALSVGAAGVLPEAAGVALANARTVPCFQGLVAAGGAAAVLRGRSTTQAACHLAPDREAGEFTDARTSATVRQAAIARIGRQEYGAARDLLRREASTRPSDDAAQFLLGLTAHALGRFDDAAQDWRTLGDGRGLLAMVGWLARIGRHDTAAVYARAVVARNPDRADGHFALAGELYALGRHGEALDEFQQAFARYSGPNNLDIANAAYTEALLFMEADRNSEGIAAAQRALAAVPGHPLFLGLIGKLYGRMGDPAAGIRALDEAVRQAPRQAQPYWDYGTFYLQQGRPDLAAAKFEEAVRYQPDGPAYLYGDLGRSYLALGRTADAAAAWRIALRLVPDEPVYRRWLSDAEARLSAGEPTR